MTARRRLPRLLARRLDLMRDDERGFVMVWVALLTVTLLIVTAIVVDLGNARQQQTQAQSVADVAALSGAGGFSDATPDPVMSAFTFAFKSLSLAPPASLGATTPCGAGCSSYAVSGRTVQVTTPWNGFANYVHVQVCWSLPTQFASVINQSNVGVCGRATAKSDDGTSGGGGGGGGGPAVSSCKSNELSTTTNNPIQTNGTLTATYNATKPLDPTSIVFIAPNNFGYLTRLANTGNPSTGYTLNYGSGNTATISYQLPAGLVTSTASLFVHDNAQNDCGQVAWSSCPVSTHDNFFETDGNKNGIADHGMNADGDTDDNLTAAALANSALLADADDSVTPAPGQLVTPGATLGATYYDETPINPARVYLFLNGTLQNPTITPPPPPNNRDSSSVGQVSPKVSKITTNTLTGQVTILVRDYLGDPIQGKTIALTNLSSGTVTPTTGVSAADGTVHFTLSKPTATFTTVDQTDNNLVIVGGSSHEAWPPPNPTDASGHYVETISSTLTAATSNGWNSAFLYVYDADTNQQGGDCSLTQFAFRFAGGTPAGPASIALIE